LAYALRAIQSVRQNDSKAALEYSRKAERLCWTAFGVGAAFWVLVLTLWLILMLSLDPSVEMDGSA
jgi:hypothetical protein